MRRSIPSSLGWIVQPPITFQSLKKAQSSTSLPLSLSLSSVSPFHLLSSSIASSSDTSVYSSLTGALRESLFCTFKRDDRRARSALSRVRFKRQTFTNGLHLHLSIALFNNLHCVCVCVVLYGGIYNRGKSCSRPLFPLPLSPHCCLLKFHYTADTCVNWRTMQLDTLFCLRLFLSRSHLRECAVGHCEC